MSEADPPVTVIAGLSQSIANVLGAQSQPAPAPAPSPGPWRRGPVGDKMMPRGPQAGAAPIVQLFRPMVPWDWPTPAVGFLPYQQFVLADRMPGSTESGVPYAPGGASFSDNYASFLSLLALEKFPLPSRLASAIAATTRPTESPVTALAPDGWARVADGAGITRWCMVYGLSTSVTAWVAEVATDPNSEVSLSVPITGEKALTLTAPGGQQQAISLLDDVEHALITASALSQVSVTPGSWFDDSLLRLGRDGPFVSSFASSTQPYAGMLGGRVSSLIVAYNPVLRIVGPDPVHSATGAALKEAAAVEIGGFTFPAPVAVPASPAGGAAYQARAAGAWIVGVTVEVFP